MSGLITSRILIATSLLLLIIGFIIDLMTPQELVVAIIYNIPLISSSFAKSKRFTVILLVLTLVTNSAAAFVNAYGGSYNLNAIANRVLAMISFVIVGGLAIYLAQTLNKLKNLDQDNERLKSIEKVHGLLERLEIDTHPELLLSRITYELKELFEAQAVVISSISETQHFATPRFVSPSTSTSFQQGESAKGFIEALSPTTAVLCLRQASELIVIGKLKHYKEPLYVFIRQPKVTNPKDLLEQSLKVINFLAIHTA